MTALATRDVEQILRFVAEAKDADGEEPVSGELLLELGRLVRADWIAYTEVDRVRRKHLVEVERPGDAYDVADWELFSWQVADMNPLIRAQEQGHFGAHKMSDFFSRRELRRSPVYEYMKLYDVEYELRLEIPSPPSRATTFLFDRGAAGPDFSERDRLVLDLLQPHLTRLLSASRSRRLLNATLDRPARPVSQLTAREQEVLSWVARGKTNAEIAELLWIAPGTVRKHLENVYTKLGVTTRTAAVARFLGLLDAEAS